MGKITWATSRCDLASKVDNAKFNHIVLVEVLQTSRDIFLTVTCSDNRLWIDKPNFSDVLILNILHNPAEVGLWTK